MINIVGIIYYSCSLVIDIECTRYIIAFKNVSNELCDKITLLRSKNRNNLTEVCNAVYFRLCIDLMHITPTLTADGFDGSRHPTYAEWERYSL